MMKKLMVLSLVLAIGSLANAGLELKGVDNVLSVGVSTGTITGFEFKIEVVDGPATLDISGMTFPATWMFAPVVQNSSELHVAVTGGDFFAKAAPVTVLDNLLLMGGVIGDGQYTIRMVATGTNIVDGQNILAGTVLGRVSYIPEPMTMGLLGLGALFLRRRK